VEQKELILTIKSLRGHIARWAVQQSPYASGPSDLGVVLDEVTRRFNVLAAEEMMQTKFIRLSFNAGAVDAWLQKLLFDIPQVNGWNERRNGRQGWGAVSMHWPMPEPDDDFIDLHALTRNIAFSLLAEERHEVQVETRQASETS
jgi:hypothetical protein